MRATKEQSETPAIAAKKRPNTLILGRPVFWIGAELKSASSIGQREARCDAV